MNTAFHIPEPCHESWQRMRPEQNGRHCDACCKVVVDFTGMNNDEVIAYLHSRNGERVCGRVKNTQLPAPESISVSPLSSAKPRRLVRFAASLWLVFGTLLFSACNKPVVKKEAARPVNTIAETNTHTVYADTTTRKVKQREQIFTEVSKDEHIIHMRPKNPELEIIHEHTLGMMEMMPDLPPADTTRR
ncbi:MAG: hypothetical protein IM638_19145 [Bacteroidetes bacterium]|nr:hypothetical protein [Bacteroidota bacterium]